MSKELKIIITAEIRAALEALKKLQQAAKSIAIHIPF